MLADLTQWLNALSDPARLRILRVLEREELGVGELARVLQMPQSTVSRHLKLLSESGWLVRRPAGTATLYRFVGDSIDEDARQLWIVARNRLMRFRSFDDDSERLRQVLAERAATDSRAFFGRIGGEWDALRSELFGDRFTFEALVAMLSPDWVVADLGCGTGNVAELLAPVVKKVIAIDREPAMLDAARKRLKGVGNVEFRAGDLMKLPLKDREVDAAVVVLVMHHVDHPADAVREIARAVKSSGVIMIVDMVAHDRASYRHTMGHKHLGFSEKDVRGWAVAAGLTDVRFIRLRPDMQSKGPGLFVTKMRRP